MAQEGEFDSCAAEGLNFNMTPILQYGRLGFFIILLVLGLGIGLIVVVGWILYRKFGTPVPSAVPYAGARQVRSSNTDGSSSSDQSPPEGPTMSDYYSKALIALRPDLKIKVTMKPLLIDMLQPPAGGFMNPAEEQSVRNAENPMEELITILLSKGDKEFNTFCDMLERSNHSAWADRLRQKAEWYRTKNQMYDCKSIVTVHPAYDVETLEVGDYKYLRKAIQNATRNKNTNPHRVMKTLYHHTYHRVVNITADYGAQCFRDIMVVARTAIKLALVERDIRALDTANTVADVLDVLHDDEDWKDTRLLEEIVNYLPEDARMVAVSLLDRYNSYLKVFEEELPVQELPTSGAAAPEGIRARVEITVAKKISEYTSKDCKVMLHMLLHICWQCPHDEEIVGANSGSTTVVFLIDKAFMGNIIQYSLTARSLWAFQELRVTRVLVGAFELNVVQLLTQHFKEALRSGLTGSMDFVGATKALPYQVYTLVDPDISEKLIIRTVYRKISQPCPEQGELVSGTADSEGVETTPEMYQDNFPPKVEEEAELSNEGKIKEATNSGELLSRVQELEDELKNSEWKKTDLTQENVALVNHLKVCQKQKDHTEQENVSLKKKLVSLLSSQGGADKGSAQTAPSDGPSKRIPRRWWLKVSAGSYDTFLLPSSPMKQAEGSREMEGEVLFRRDTKSNRLKAASGTEWMYQRGALERGRQANLRRHQFTRYHWHWLADNVQKEEEDSCKLWFLRSSPDMGTVREREEHRVDEGKVSDEEVTGSGELLSRVQELEDELKDSERKRTDLIQSNTALQKIVKACREQEVCAKQEIASLWERLGGADQDSAPTSPSEVPLKRTPCRWWLKVFAGSYDTSLLPSSPMKQAEGSRRMEGEVVFRRDTKSNRLKAASGTEWMYQRGALERGRQSAPAKLHQHRFTRYHQSWLADNVQKEEEESCKQWLLQSSPDVGTVREGEEQGLMSKVYEQALRDYQVKIAGDLIVQNVISDLEPYLTKVEYLQVQNKLGNIMAQVDELFRILLTKGNRHFNAFCHALEDNGYQHWAQQLRSSTDGAETEAARRMSFSMTIGSDSPTLRISMSENAAREHIQGTLSLTHYNSENAVILENIPDCDTRTLEMYIQTQTGCGKDQNDLKRSKTSPSCALLTGLQGSEHVDEVLQKLKHPDEMYQGFTTLEAVKWPEVNQLILTGLEQYVTKEYLEAYFRNEEKSGCSALVDVTMKGRGIALVTLPGSQDVVKVVDKDAHDERFLCHGVQVKVFHPKLIPWLELNAQELRVITAGNETYPPIVVSISSELFDFFSRRDSLLKPLEMQLDNICAKFEISNLADKGVITVYPETRSQGPDECKEVVERFLMNFDTQYRDVPKTADRKVILEHLHELHRAQDKVVAILSEERISIVGHMEAVTEEWERLDTVISNYTVTIKKEKLEINVLLCIDLCERRALKAKYPTLKFKVLCKESSLSVKGLEVQCNEFLSEVKAIKPTVVDVQLPPLAIIFLGSIASGMRLVQEVMHKYQGVGHYITDAKGHVLLDDISTCARLKVIAGANARQVLDVAQEVKESVAVDVVEVPTEFTNTVRQDCWIKARRRMESEYSAFLVPQLEEHPPAISIVSKSNSAADVKKAVNDFISQECYATELITLKEGQYKYMMKESHAWIELHGEMKTLQKENQIKFKLPGKGVTESPKVTVEGFTTKVKQVSQRIRDIQGSISEDTCCISRPGLLEFCKSTNGDQQLNGMASARKAVLVVRTGEECEIEEGTTAQELPHKTAVYTSTAGGGKLELMQGDLTEYPVDILVNAANADLQHAGGLAGQISRKGGPEIQAESSKYIQEHGRLREGDAVLLHAKGVLPCKAIIHAVGPRWAEGRANEEGVISKAVHESLKLAESDSANYTSIVFSALGTGIFRVPLSVSACGMIAGVRKFFEENPDSTMRVVIMVYQQSDIAPFRSAIKKYSNVKPFTLVEDLTVFEEDSGSETELEMTPQKPPRPPPPQASPAATRVHSNVQETMNTDSKENAAAHKLELQKGAVTDCKVDVYVSPTNASLDLSRGAVAQSLLKAGGAALQDECTAYHRINGDIAEWDIGTTGGAGLKCKHVIHTVGGHYRRTASQQGMKSMVIKVMAECDRLKALSVAFPALGTGNLGFPSNVAAKIMVQSAHDYLQENPNSSLKKVVFIIYLDEVFNAFQRELSALTLSPTISSGAQPPSTVMPMQDSLLSHAVIQKNEEPMPIVAVKGPLIEAQVDVYVNTTNPSLDLSSGAVAQSLLKAGGPALQDECTAHHRTNGDIAVWDIATTGGPGLNCKYVIHTVGGHYEEAASQQAMKNMVIKVMAECDRLKASSVAFPALGTGNLGFPPDVAAKIMVQAAHQYLQGHPGTSLKRIVFIIYQDVILHSFKRELTALKHAPGLSSGPPGAQSFPLVQPVQASLSSHAVNTKRVPKRSSQHLPVEVIKGPLTNAKVDVYINTTNASLDLSLGAVAQSLFKAGGPALQDECTAYQRTNGDVAEWDIATTAGADLKCKHVIHTVCSQYDGAASEQKMKQMISKVLHQCDTLQARSVAFPAIGTGQLGFPSKVIAKIMLQTIDSHLQQSTTIQRVEVMIDDDATFRIFQEILDSVSEFPSHAKSAPVSEHVSDSPKVSPGLRRQSYSQPLSSSKGRSVLKEMFLQDMCIQFVRGDITEEDSDYLVNIATSSPRPQDTGLEGAFLKKGGQKLQIAYMAAVKEKGAPTKTKIIETGGPVGGLKCKMIGHVCPPNEHKELKGTIKSLLEQAEKAHSQSVVFPLVLKAGKKEFTVDKVAKYCYKGVRSFSKNPYESLTKVVFIHPEEQLTHQFFLAFEKASSDTSALPKVMQPLQAIKKWSRSEEHSSDDVAAFKRHTSARRSISSNLSVNIDEDQGPAIVITAYASTDVVAKMVTKEVKKFVETQFKAVIVNDPHVPQLQLQPHTLEKLAKEAERKHVMLTYEDCEVVLQGHKHDTEQLRNSVRKELSQIKSAKDRSRSAVEMAEKQRYQAEMRTRQVQAAKEVVEAAKEQVESQKQVAERGRLQAEAHHAKKSQELEQIRKHGERPDGWDPMPIDPVTHKEVSHHVIDIPPGSKEYMNVEGPFSASMGTGFIRGMQRPYRGVAKIERIQNPVLYGQYIARKKAMDNANPSSVKNEHRLFHGCPGDVIGNINSTGFNRSFCGKNATAYGYGVYFTKDAQYSARDIYSPPDSNGHKHIYLAKVLTGLYTKGSSGMREPPARRDPTNPAAKFDSTVDDVDEPGIFVVFYDGQAYPEYLITLL